MLQPYQGRILDPACGSCGMFIQSAQFIAAHGGSPEKLSIYGQEMQPGDLAHRPDEPRDPRLCRQCRATRRQLLLDDAASRR